MPALGAAFAIFTALTLSSEAAYLRSAESRRRASRPARRETCGRRAGGRRAAH
jgi:hypothetical protein